MTAHPMDVNTNTRVRWAVIRRLPELAPLAGKKVLDLGSGLGFFSLRLGELGADVHAVDVDKESLSYLGERCGIEATHADIERDPLPPGPFDVVFIGDVLEHITDPAGLIERCAGSLIIGGHLLVTVPALEGPLIHTKGKMLGHEHGSQKHERHGFYLHELTAMTQGAGLTVVRSGMTVYWLAELFMQLTKRGYLKKEREYGSQSDVIAAMTTPAYRLLRAVYPLLMAVFRTEQAIGSAFGFKGHCHVLLCRQGRA